MKKLLALLFLLLFVFQSLAFAGYVNSYTRKDGTYVQGYNRSEPNNTVQDNYSHKGNMNPYTGQMGSSYDRNSPSSEYYNGGFNNNSNDRRSNRNGW
jgi:hypothetical protein